MIETERRYLIKDSHQFRNSIFMCDYVKIHQGYFQSTNSITGRIRLSNYSHGYRCAVLTVKKPISAMSKMEFESELNIDVAADILRETELPSIHKTRYLYRINDDLVWDVDVFEKSNSGLIIAELEIPDEHYEFDVPCEWDMFEITGLKEFSNSNLAFKPLNAWTDEMKGPVSDYIN